MAVAGTLNRKVPKTKRQMKFSSCLTTKQWHYSHHLICDGKESILRKKKWRKAFTDVLAWILVWYYLSIHCVLRKPRKIIVMCTVHSCLTKYPQMSPVMQAWVTHTNLPWLWQTLNRCVFLLLKNSLGYFFCVKISFVFEMFFPRLSSHIYMLLIS